MAYAFQNAPSKQLILDIPSVGRWSGFKFYDPFFLETPTPYPATLFLKWLSLFNVTSPFFLLLSLAPYLWTVGMSAESWRGTSSLRVKCTDTFLLVDPFCAWPSLVCKVHPLVVEASTKLFSRSLRRTSFSDSTVSVSHQGYSTNSYSNFQFHNFFLAVINNFSLLYNSEIIFILYICTTRSCGWSRSQNGCDANTKRKGLESMTVKDEAFPLDGYGNQRRQFKLNKKTSRGKTK